LNQTPLTLDEYTTIDGDSLHRYTFPYSPAVQNIPYLHRLIAELEQRIITTLELAGSGGIPEPDTRTSVLPPEPPSPRTRWICTWTARSLWLMERRWTPD
jgi:hypothetical protein